MIFVLYLKMDVFIREIFIVWRVVNGVFLQVREKMKAALEKAQLKEKKAQLKVKIAYLKAGGTGVII